MLELNSVATNNEGNNLKKILQKYTRYWYVFLIGVLLCLGMAFLYLRYVAIPQYRITSTVLVKDKDKGSGFSEAENLGDLGLIKPSGNIEDQIGILSSLNLLEKVLIELNLNVGYLAEGQIDDVEIYGKYLPFIVISDPFRIPSFPESISIIPKDSTNIELRIPRSKGKNLNGVYQYGDTINTPEGTFSVIRNPVFTSSEIDRTPISVQFRNASDLASAYYEELIVEPANKTGSLLQVSLLDAIPERGEDIVLKLIELYAEESVKYQNQLAISTIEIIDKRLKLLTGEITNVEKDIATYKQENDLTNISSDAAVYLESAREANQQLDAYQTQIDILNSIENYLRQGGDERLVPSSLNIQDPTLSALIAQFNEQQLDKKALLRNTPSDNPLVVNLDRTLADLRSDILENLKNIREGLLIAQKNVKANSYRARAQIAKVPSAERALLTINRDQGLKQELYLYLLQKREEEALSLEAPITNTRIVDPPRSSRYPESPNKTSIYLGALILGLFLPISTLYVKNTINDTIQSTEDIKKSTQAPVMGQIAHSEDRLNLVVNETSTSSVAELFRLMRYNLSYLTEGQPNKVILVTSGKKGEGKTFFTINLAASLALAGSKVVALSFDLRSPKLLQNMRIKEKLGITDYIQDPKVTLKKITLASPDVDDLYVIGSGPIPMNAGELMLNKRIATLFEDLKAQYDYVLIDSAPVGKVADAFALAPYIDATVYIVRQNYSGKEELKSLNDIIEHQKLKHPMVVLNDTKALISYGYRNAREARS